MKKILSRVLASLIALCLCVTSISIEGFASDPKETIQNVDEIAKEQMTEEDNKQYGDEMEEGEETEEDEFVKSEDKNVELENKNSDKQTESNKWQKDNKQEDKKAVVNTETNKKVLNEDGDPGAGRLQGDVPAEFYGFESGTNARSGYQHNDRYSKGYTIEKGIDVSYYQGEIDWEKVKKAGIQFAIVRVGYRGYGKEGNLAKDPKGIENIKEALKAGIPIGVYIFSQAITEAEAREEADYILKQIEGYEITLPVVMDYEYASVDGALGGRLYDAQLSKSAATKVCKAFCKRVTSKGYTPMVYANSDMLRNHLNADEISSEYPIWLAHYTNKTDYAGAYDFWQYTSKGTVSGISGRVDMNFHYIKETVPGISGLKATITTMDSKEESKASGYAVLRKNSKGDWERLATLSGADQVTYTDKSLEPGTNYTYRVKAYVKTDEGTEYGESAEVVGQTTGINISELKVAESTATSISLSWKEESKAAGYAVLRKNSKGDWERLATLSGADQATYTDESLDPGTSYVYRVKAYVKTNAGTVYGKSLEVVGQTDGINVSELKILESKVTSISFSWKEESKASGYAVLRKKKMKMPLAMQC